MPRDQSGASGKRSRASTPDSARKRLLECLSQRSSWNGLELFEWFVDDLLARWGAPGFAARMPDGTQAALKAAIAAYQDAITLHEPFYDLLGPVIMDLRSTGTKSRLGSFYTPWHLARCMATMSMGGSPTARTDEIRLMRATDPCLGSGVMMLALACEICLQHGPASLRQWSFSGCDIDRLACRAAAVQFLANCSVHNLPVGEVLVLCGNSLIDDEDKEVIVHATAPGVAPDVAPDDCARAIVRFATSDPRFPQQRDQLSLFDVGDGLVSR